MISISCMIGTGLKKCMPMTRSGRLVAAASLVMEIEDVLLARIVSGAQRPSSRPNTSRLTSSFSNTASITSCARATSLRSVLGVTRPKIASRSSGVNLPFSVSLPRLF